MTTTRDQPDRFYSSNAQWPQAQQWHYRRKPGTAAVPPGGRGTLKPALQRSQSASTLAGIQDSKRARQEDTFQGKLQSQLFFAILKEDTEQVKFALSKGVSVEAKSDSGTTPLMLAAGVGAIAICKLLLEKGASLDARDQVGATPLILAAFKGQAEAVKLLLGAVAASTAGAAGVVQQLASHTLKGETALMAAAKMGHAATVKVLLEAGAAVDAVAAGEKCVTACMMAAHSNRAEVVKVLLAHGANPTLADADGKTALMYAVGQGATAVVELLVPDKGEATASATAVVDTRQPVASTAEASAPAVAPATTAAPPVSAHANNAEAASADVDAADAQGMTAVLHACAQGQLAAVQMLVAKFGKTLLDKRDRSGRSALDLACSSGSVELVTWLMEQGVGELELVADSGVSPLFTAVRGGHVALVELFLAKGARLEVRDAKGRTPLAWAAAHGKTAMCSFLINKGANLLATDASGQVPRQLAQGHSHRETAHFLTDAARTRLCVQ